MTSHLELTDVLADLYLQTPGEFVAVRAARARTVKDDGDAELARQIARLPKPSVGAWLANLLAARRTNEIDNLVDLGALIRDAEKNLDAAEMRQLGKQRLQLIRALAQQGKQLASDAGQKVSPAAMLDLEQTLHAAMADPAAADAVRSGRLLRALTSNGIDPVSVDDAVALPEVAVARAARPRLAVVENRPSARAVADAEKKADEALARAAEADAERAAIREKRTALAEHRAELNRQRQELADRVSELDRGLASAERDENALSRAAASADHRADVASRAAERATERLRALRKG